MFIVIETFLMSVNRGETEFKEFLVPSPLLDTTNTFCLQNDIKTNYLCLAGEAVCALLFVISYQRKAHPIVNYMFIQSFQELQVQAL